MSKVVHNQENLSHMDFRGADLELAIFRQCALDSVDFVNSRITAIFENCDLRNTNFSHADLSEAYFKDCSFDYTSFARCNLTHSAFEGCDLVRSDFSEANLVHSIFANCTEDSCYFSSANLANSDLSFPLIRLDFCKWSICIQRDTTSIGCVFKPNDFWLTATPKDVRDFAVKADVWWERHGNMIQNLIKGIQE